MTLNDAAETKYFHELTPERILVAVEQTGVRCTGRLLPLNSMENRVYEVEVEVDPEKIKSPSEKFRVVKFYRPGRWSKAQILEEHQFLKDLKEAEVPVVSPLEFADGSTVREAPDINIWFTVFPKQGGRIEDELNDDRVKQLGRLIARMHMVGSGKPCRERLVLTPDKYYPDNIEFLKREKFIPPELLARYSQIIDGIYNLIRPLFNEIRLQRIHGDCHYGNILWGSAGPTFVDFDDMLTGPCVQDIWLIVPGQDPDSLRQRDLLLEGYTQMRPFDRAELRLVEPLRTLRMIHYAAWIARRWEDPAFKRVFTNFGTVNYWQDHTMSLQEQFSVIQEELSG